MVYTAWFTSAFIGGPIGAKLLFSPFKYLLGTAYLIYVKRLLDGVSSGCSQHRIGGATCWLVSRRQTLDMVAGQTRHVQQLVGACATRHSGHGEILLRTRFRRCT